MRRSGCRSAGCPHLNQPAACVQATSTWTGPLPQAGRIGPNAITRVAEALVERVGDGVTATLFGAAGLRGYLSTPPCGMVAESEVAALHRALRAGLDRDTLRQVTHSAGERTADDLLTHRIPRAVQRLLKILPPSWAARVLLSAIRAHAWTFCGSGTFTARAVTPVELTIRGNPLCAGVTDAEPACTYYAATFERLFRVLVHAEARVVETDCEARGDARCRFEVRWPTR